MLTPMRVKTLASKQSQRTNRKAMRKAFAISNTKAATFHTCTPSELPFGADNRFNPNEYLSEDEIIDSVLNPHKRFHVKNETRLHPELVSEEVIETWKQKIHQNKPYRRYTK